MFYSNEVYLANYKHTRVVEKGYRFIGESIEDILVDETMIQRHHGMATQFLPTIKSRLFRLVDVLDVEIEDGESTNSIENRPNVVLEGIYNDMTLVTRVRDILFCSKHHRNKLPTIIGYGGRSTMVTHPWDEETDLVHRDSSSYYLTEEFIDNRENSGDLNDYTSWINTSKLWKAGKFIDRFDSRISSSTSNRFYLDRRVQLSLYATYSQVLHNSYTYSRCEYCREMHHKGMNEVGGIDFICHTCCRKVEVPCGVCLGTDTFQHMNHRTRYKDKINSIYKDMGIEFLHSSCASVVYKECSKCKNISRVDLDYIHSLDSIPNRKQKLREFIREGGEHFKLEGYEYCSSCANLHLNHRLYSPYRVRALPDIIHIDKVYTRHTGIESEVITNYNDSEEYRDCEIIPSQFEVVSDGSLSEGGVEYRTARPLIGSEVCNALSDLEKAHRRHDNWTDDSCGIHIHMNAIDFGFVEIKNLLMLSSSIQDTIYESLPADRRGNEYARKITMTPERISEIEDLPTLVSSYYSMAGGTYSLSRYNESRYIGTNLHARFFLGTIEFRYHEGHIYSPPIRSWIRFLNRLMDTSKDLHKNKKLYQQVLSSTSNAMDIIDGIGGRESTEYIEKRINRNK